MTLTSAILSWKSPLTLRNTLESYQYHQLNQYIDQKVIFFQEISAEDSQIAKEFGYDAIGSPNNIGIGSAYKQLVDYTTSDLFLFLENDWLLIENPYYQIKGAIDLLTITDKWDDWDYSGNVDVVRLRHRTNPGAPLWTRQYKGNELSRPEYLLDCIHWTANPDSFQQIERRGDWYVTKARYANWTNNPTMFRTDWLRSTLLPRLEGDIEKALQPWWQEQDYLVAQGDGLFTHMRLDR